MDAENKNQTITHAHTYTDTTQLNIDAIVENSTRSPTEFRRRTNRIHLRMEKLSLERWIHNIKEFVLYTLILESKIAQLPVRIFFNTYFTSVWKSLRIIFIKKNRCKIGDSSDG